MSTTAKKNDNDVSGTGLVKVSFECCLLKKWRDHRLRHAQLKTAAAAATTATATGTAEEGDEGEEGRKSEETDVETVKPVKPVEQN